MQIRIGYGRDHVTLEAPGGSLVGVRRQPQVPPVADPAAAVREALEHPLGFPALRRALTPDDHVAIVVDEQTPRLVELLTPLLEHVTAAGVAAENITLVCPPPASRQEWVEALPEAFEEVQVQVHDPTDRKRLSYLATTRRGKRIYLNRTAVDADQLVVLGRRGYDPVLGYSGAEGALYPALSDEATREEMLGRWSLDVPGDARWPVRQEAAEVAWLLGAPFLLQVIEGEGDEIAHVVGGLVDTAVESQRLLDARWRVHIEERSDNVLVTLSGDPARHGFGELARALTCASRVVRPDGRIVVLSQSRPVLDKGAEVLLHAEDMGAALRSLQQDKAADLAAIEWATAVRQAAVFLLSDLPAEVAEDLFTTPLEHAGQVQRLLDAGGTWLVLPDAHKTMAVLA